MKKGNIVASAVFFSAILCVLMPVNASEIQQAGQVYQNHNDDSKPNKRPPLRRMNSSLTLLSKNSAPSGNIGAKTKSDVSIAARIQPFITANFSNAHEYWKYSTIAQLLQDYESKISATIYPVISKLGVKKIVINGYDVNVIDTSWPVIKEYVEKILSANDVQNAVPESQDKGLQNQDAASQEALQYVRKVFDTLKDVTYKKDENGAIDRSKTDLDEDKLNKIMDLTIGEDKLFNIDNISSEHQNLFRQLLRDILLNWSGFQEIASMLVVGALNNSRQYAFRHGYSTIKLYDISRPNDHYNSEKHFIALAMNSDGSNNFIQKLGSCLVHEAKHAYDFMLFGGGFQSLIGVGTIHYYLSPLCHNMLNVAGGEFREIFFPQLSPSKMDPIVENIESHITPWLNKKDASGKTNLDKIKEARQNDGDFFEKYKWLYWMFHGLVCAGFSDILFKGIDLETKGYKYDPLVNSKTIARAFYIVSAIVEKASCRGNNSTNQPCDFSKLYNGEIFESKWDGEAEPLAIVGLLPYTIDGKIFLIYTKQNEVIFTKRASESIDAKNEQTMGIYRNHHDIPLQPYPDTMVNSRIQSMIKELTGDMILDYATLNSIKYPEIKLHDEKEGDSEKSATSAEQNIEQKEVEDFLRAKIAQLNIGQMYTPVSYNYYNSSQLGNLSNSETQNSQTNITLWKMKSLIFSGEKDKLEEIIKNNISEIRRFGTTEIESLLLTAVQADDAEILLMLLDKINGEEIVPNKLYHLSCHTAGNKYIPVIYNRGQNLCILQGNITFSFLADCFSGPTTLYLEEPNNNPACRLIASIEWTTLLHVAAKYNKTKVLKKLLESKDAYYYGEANTFDSKGYTPLHVACMHNNLESIEILLNYKADPSLHFYGNINTMPAKFLTRMYQDQYDCVARALLKMIALVDTVPSGFSYIMSRALYRVYLNDYLDFIKAPKKVLQELESKLSCQDDWEIENSDLESAMFKDPQTFVQRSWNTVGLYLYLLTFCPKMSLRNYTFLLEKVKKSGKVPYDIQTFIDFGQKNFSQSGIDFTAYKKEAEEILGLQTQAATNQTWHQS